MPGAKISCATAVTKKNEMVQALHNDVVDDLLDDSAKQSGDVIDSGGDILDIEGRERTMLSKSSGSRPLPSFSTILNEFGDFEDFKIFRAVSKR